jgi:hypothetical protein
MFIVMQSNPILQNAPHTDVLPYPDIENTNRYVDDITKLRKDFLNITDLIVKYMMCSWIVSFGLFVILFAKVFKI